MSNRDMVSRRTWIFEADVHGYYIPEKPLVINDFELKTIEDEEKGTRYIGLLTVRAIDSESAEKLAREKFERIFKALTLFTGRDFEFEIKSGSEMTYDKRGEREHMGFITITFPFVEVLKSEMIYQTYLGTQEILKLIQKSDSRSEKAIEYFMIGTKLSRWPREAFLPFFKAIELISEKFIPEFENRIKEKIPDLEPEEIKRLATSSRKILNACEILGIEKANEKIKRIVTTRNRHDIAHATLKKTFKKEDVDACRELARKLIVNYLISLRKNTEKTDINQN
jgi:hypothetical protein